MGLLTMFCQQTPTPLNRPSRVVLICGREQSSNRLDAIFADRSSDCHQPHGLQGRLARSTAVRFFAVLSRARALRAITQSAPARPRTQRASRNQLMASAKEARNPPRENARCSYRSIYFSRCTSPRTEAFRFSRAQLSVGIIKDKRHHQDNSARSV